MLIKCIIFISPSDLQPLQQVFIGVEAHELKDREEAAGTFGFKRGEEIADSLSELSREGKERRILA